MFVFLKNKHIAIVIMIFILPSLFLAGCGLPITDNLPDNIPKGYIELYQAESEEFPFFVKVWKIENGQEKLISKLDTFTPKHRISYRPGSYNFKAQCGNAIAEFTANVFDDQVTPVGIIVTVLNKSGKTQYWGDREITTTTFHFDIKATPETSIPLHVPKNDFFNLKSIQTITKERNLAKNNKTSNQEQMKNFNKVLELKGRGHVKSAQFSPDGRSIATLDSDRIVKVWDSNTGSLLRTLKPDKNFELHTACFSGDGRWIAAISGGTTGFDHDPHFVQIWNFSTGRTFKTIKSRHTFVYDLSFSMDNKYIIAALGFANIPQVWDIDTLSPKKIFVGHHGDINCVEVSPDGRYLATGSKDKTVKLWDIKTGRPRTTLQGHSSEVISLDYSNDSRRIASCQGFGNTIYLWSVPDGKKVFEKHILGPRCVALSPDNKYLAVGDAYGKIHLLDARDGKNLGEQKSYSGFLGVITMRNIEFSPDSKRILVAADDDTVKVWEIK